jgi:signal peptidase I
LHTESAEVPKKSVFREYAEAIGIALLLALFIRTFVVQAFKIPSGSMEDTLLVGDHLLVNKFAYGVKNPLTGALWLPVSTPQRGEVIVFKFPQNPDQDFIKRVVGIPGDTVQGIDKKLYVNGKEITEPYVKHKRPEIIPGEVDPRDTFGPVTVPPNALFVMGDNRDNSHDSRFWGFVDFRAIKGKSFMLYWSWDRDNFAVRWSRIGNFIH